jgi:hypothetical protein
MYSLGGIEIVQVNWGDFVKHWRTFVEFNDEGLLLCDTTDCGLVVSPQGFFYKVSA